MLDIEVIAKSESIEAREQDIQVEISASKIAGTNDISVDLCVYHVTSESKHAETMDVHHATSLARIEHATPSQIDAVMQCLTDIITRATAELERTLPGGRVRME